MTKDIVDAYEEYLKVLNAELSELYSLAHVHGWRSSRVEDGKACREKIAKLKKLIENN